MAKNTQNRSTQEIWLSRDQQSSIFEQLKYFETELKKDFHSASSLRNLVERLQEEDLWESGPIEVPRQFIESTTVRQKICERYHQYEGLREREFAIAKVADMFVDPVTRFEYQGEMDGEFLDVSLKDDTFPHSVQKWFPLSSDEQLKNSLSYEYILSTLFEKGEINNKEKAAIEKKIAGYVSRQSLSAASANARDSHSSMLTSVISLLLLPLLTVWGGSFPKFVLRSLLIGTILSGLYYCSQYLDEVGNGIENQERMEKDHLRKCLANGTSQIQCKEQFEEIT